MRFKDMVVACLLFMVLGAMISGLIVHEAFPKIVTSIESYSSANNTVTRYDLTKCSLTKGWEVYYDYLGPLPKWQNASGVFIVPNGAQAHRVTNISNITQIPPNAYLWENVTTYHDHGPSYCFLILPNGQLPITEVRIYP